MLITKKVLIKWNGISRKHYEDLGYKWTKLHNTFEVEVKDLTPCSTVRVEVECDCCNKKLNLKWEDYLNRVKSNGKYYCKKCASKLYGAEKIQKTMLEKSGKSFEQWCIENDRQDLLKRWSDKNKKLPSEIGYGSGSKIYFKCPKGIHEDELFKLNTLTSFAVKDIECKQCNSFAQYLIDTYGNNALDLYYDFEKNTLNPWEIPKSSRKEIWIRCQEKEYHGSYKVSCGNFYMGRKCPYCGNFKVHPLDSLGYLLESKNLLNIWSEKNKKSPYEFLPSSHVIAIWKCPNNKHDEYKRSIKQTTKYNFKCPECSEEEKLIRMYSLCGENNYNYNPNLTNEEREFRRYKLYGESHKKWRNQVFKRDNYICQCCGEKGGKLNAHHLDGWNWAINKRFDLENGVTLCRKCHLKFHNEFGNKNNTKSQYEQFSQAS